MKNKQVGPYGQRKILIMQIVIILVLISFLKKSGTIKKIPSGSTEYTKSNNIYDFVRNVMEWTMSVVLESNRNLQGGHYWGKGEDIQYETYNEALSPHSSDFKMGSRATLYIK
ncbi:MAG: hypothetical protein HFJ49_00520 [Clostridia bacterium]|nr:hypothetical protein [Clostridia bacterium]